MNEYIISKHFVIRKKKKQSLDSLSELLLENFRDLSSTTFHTGQPTRGGVQKSDQNPHHPPKGGVTRMRSVNLCECTVWRLPNN